jgi:hypothetical protein
MTAEQAAENIKRRVGQQSRRTHGRPADVVSDHNWLDPRIRHRAVEQVVREVLIDFLLGEPR